MQNLHTDNRPHNCGKTKIALIIALTIGFIWYILLILATSMFIRMYRLKYKLIVMFFLMLNIAIIWRISFFFNLYFDLKENECELKYEWRYFLTKDLTNMAFVQAVIFSLFRWLYWICTINQEIQDATILWNWKTMNILMAVSTVVNIFVFTFSIAVRWKYPEKHHMYHIFIASRILKSIVYLLFAILYIVAGVLLYK